MTINSGCTGFPGAGNSPCSHINKPRFLFGSFTVAIRVLFGNFKHLTYSRLRYMVARRETGRDKPCYKLPVMIEAVTAGSFLVALHGDPLGSPLLVAAWFSCRQKQRQP